MYVVIPVDQRLHAICCLHQKNNLIKRYTVILIKCVYACGVCMYAYNFSLVFEGGLSTLHADLVSDVCEPSGATFGWNSTYYIIRKWSEFCNGTI